VDTHVSRFVSKASADKAKGSRQDRTGVNGTGAAQRLDHLFTLADLSRPPSLQSRRPLCEECVVEKLCPSVDLENRESAKEPRATKTIHEVTPNNSK